MKNRPSIPAAVTAAAAALVIAIHISVQSQQERIWAGDLPAYPAIIPIACLSVVSMVLPMRPYAAMIELLLIGVLVTYVGLSSKNHAT